MKPSATRIEQENGSSSGKQERRNLGRATAAVGVTLSGVQRTARSSYLYAIAAARWDTHRCDMERAVSGETTFFGGSGNKRYD